MSACGKTRWCCQGRSADSTWCCRDGSKIFTLPEVAENPVQTSPAGSLSPPSKSKLGTISLGLGIGLGLGLPLLLLLTACTGSFLRKRRRELRRQAIAVESQNDHTQISGSEMLELSAHRESELHMGPRSPTAEISGRSRAVEMSG